MHPTILVKRKAEAVGALIYAAEALAKTLNLDPALVAGLHPVGIKDAHVREMMLLEGAANLIQAVAIQEGAIREGVPVETPEPEHADAESQFLAPESAPEPPAEKKPTRGKRKK